MKKLMGLLLAGITPFISANAYADHYEFDKSHTSIAFYIGHLGFSSMLGVFTSYNGTFEFDEKKPEKSAVDVTLQPSGIRTESDLLDHELRGEKFFNTDKYPDIHFVSTSIKVTGDHMADLMGDMTMLGVTKPVTIHVKFNKADYQPVTNLYIAGFSADGTLNRSEFGLSFGIPMVADEVRFHIEVEGVNQERKEAEKLKH